VTSVAQVGTDRIVELQFSDGQYRLFLEFYAGGNIVLADKELSILSLLRIVPEGPEQEEMRIGLKYSLENRQNYHGMPPLTQDRITAALNASVERAETDAANAQKRSKRKPGEALRRALAVSLNELPPMLIDHALRAAQFDSSLQIEQVLKDSQTLDKLTQALTQAHNIVEEITNSTECKGYILAKTTHKPNVSPDKKSVDLGEIQRGSIMYEDFHPFRPQQYKDDPDIVILEFSSFNMTVDEFFSSLESQKLESRLTEREEHAKKKLENAKQDHEKRLGGLQQVQELNVRKAQAIEDNLERVQEAISAVNSLIAKGIGWVEIARLIEIEQDRHNVVAEMIKLPLKLYENTATLLLAEANFGDEDDFDGDETDSAYESDNVEDDVKKSQTRRLAEPADSRLAVDVDLALSPWSNARQYYDQKKSAAAKEQKTLQSSEKAIRSTEKKITADLKKGLKQEKELMRPQRKAYWFEKFIYFISSEGYLVLGGKDAQQNEILYKRYLRKGDAYVHADLPGAASVIIKNKPGKFNDTLPPGTLSQAGTLSVATSNAWENKAVMAAWWVYADQVSKMSNTAEYLQPGVFTIQGQKNFLPPAPLLLGFAILFRVSDESKQRHLKHRVQGTELAEPTETPAISAAILDGTEQDDQVRYEGTEITGEGNEAEPEDDDPGDMVETSSSLLEADKEGSTWGSEDDNESDAERDNPLQPSGNQSLAPSPHPKEEVNGKHEQGHENDEVDEDEDAVTHNDNGDDEGQASAAKQADNEPDKREGKQGIRHLSARERRLARKGVPTVSTEPPQSTSQEPTRSSTPSSNLSSNVAHVRGKHGKKQKIKTKYADQDDEDRALAMRILGSAAAEEKATNDAATKAGKEQDLAAQKERRRKQHLLAAAKGKEAEEKRRLEFEGEEGQEGEEPEALDLDAFVGVPAPGDEILDALVVCGPWDSIGVRCRWRVKLQPGTTKKGKAVREILGRWNSMITEREKKKRPGAGDGNEFMMEEEKVRQKEAELIRGVRETEVVGIVPVGKVRAIVGADGGKGRGSGAGKGKRGGKGSKKTR